MARSSFNFKGYESSTYGITLIGPAPMIRPQERVKHITIPGRIGDLTLLETNAAGDYVMESYIQTIDFIINGNRIGDAYKWLIGEGELYFSNRPQSKQYARVIGAVTLSKISHNLNRYRGTVQFYCQPALWNETYRDEAITYTGSGSTHTFSTSTFYSPRPKLVVTTGGDGWTPIITVNGSAFQVNLAPSAVSSIREFTIDSAAGTVTAVSGNATVNLLPYSTGDFPVLKPDGSNTLKMQNCTKVVLTRRNYWL